MFLCAYSLFSIVVVAHFEYKIELGFSWTAVFWLAVNVILCIVMYSRFRRDIATMPDIYLKTSSPLQNNKSSRQRHKATIK